jgi:SAM-dependent methyltransferase
MSNYNFCANWVIEKHKSETLRILDYGCGSGQIVHILRNEGLSAYGCDVFYEGGDSSKDVSSKSFSDGIIIKMHGNKIPFEDEYFDIILNNQVLEHVENIDDVLTEMYRTLKPGGYVLSLFPHKGVWREGHSGIPFLHWFRKSSRFRIMYAAFFRILGFGYYKKNKTILKWSRDFCEWLDQWTHYRSYRDIELSFKKHFCSIDHIEVEWFDYRLKKFNKILKIIPGFMKKVVVRKFGGLVFTAQKSN